MATAYASQTATLLFLKPAKIQHKSAGRLVQFDVAEPDSRFSTGPVQERVLSYLSEYQQPISLSKLTHAVNARCERVSASLRNLIATGQVVAYEIDQHTTEYALNANA